MREYMGDFQYLEVLTWLGLKELSIVILTLFVFSKPRSSFSDIKFPRHNTSVAIADEAGVGCSVLTVEALIRLLRLESDSKYGMSHAWK